MMPVGCVCEGAKVSEQRKVVGEPSDPTALVLQAPRRQYACPIMETSQIQIMFVMFNNTIILTFIGFGILFLTYKIVLMAWLFVSSREVYTWYLYVYLVDFMYLGK